MMNWKNLILTFVLASVTSGVAFAQANILNAKDPSEIGVKTEAQIEADNDGPLPYGYVDDRDILWSKTVWEFIDLDERVNFPYYYPVDTLNIGQDRRSLYDVLLKSFKADEIDVYDDSYFNHKISYQDISAGLKKVDTLDVAFDFLNANPGEPLPPGYVTETNITAYDIQGFRVKGMWYFDKRQGELKYRLLGLAPVSKDVNFLDSEEATFIDLFWVWYPSAREILHKSKAFNERNSAAPLSFDHLLNSRRFSGMIYKVDNVYGDREIERYIQDNALFQLLESDKIKEEIRDREQDMWSY